MRLKIFVPTYDEIRLVRRIQRDIVECGRDLDWRGSIDLGELKSRLEKTADC
jgi:hypothetical protein